MFSQEDMDKICNEMVSIAKQIGENESRENLIKLFYERVRENLHVVLAFSPVGGKFRDRCRIFPSLVSCCTIDWYEPWPSSALHTVANDFIDKMDLSEYEKDNNQGKLKANIAELATFCHSEVVSAAAQFTSELSRVYYVTPAVYVEFFSLFHTVLNKRAGEMKQKKEQLEKGVEKLAETNSKVQEMEAELQSLRPMLQQKAVETDQLMDKLKVDREKVNEAHKTISAEEETVKVVRSEAMVLAAEAQEDLDKAMPLLQAALEAVEDLKNRKSDLAVVKTFVKPPQLVVEVMEAVCLLCGSRPDWASAKSLLAQTDFFNRLLDVHNHPVPEATLMRIRQMAADPRYDVKKVTSVS